MRYREKINFHDLEVIYTDTNNGSDPVDTVSVKTIPDAVGNYIKTWDIVTPNFHSRKKKGEFIVNPYTNGRYNIFNSINGVAGRSNFLNPDGSRYSYSREGPQLTYMMGLTGDILLPRALHDNSEVDRAADLASTACRAQLRGAETDILVLLAELKKTFSMLLNPLSNLYTLLERIERHRRQVAYSLSLAQFIASEWLRYRYGILPIMYDIEGIIKALEKDKTKGPRHARGSEKLSREDVKPPLFFRHGDIQTDYQDTYTEEILIKCGLVNQASLKTTDFLGLNLRSIPVAAWELIPFSFVVDWFMNVQVYISAMASAPSGNEKGAWTTITRTQTATRAVIGSALFQNHAFSTLTRGMSGTETHVYRVKDRVASVRPASLTSKINFSLFNFKDKRVLDMFGLIIQKLR